MKTNSTFRTLLLLLSVSLSPLTISAQTPLLRIHDVQGNGDESPFLGQLVSLDLAVVTFANDEFAYVQDPIGDGDPTTSEGLLVIGGNTLQLTPGDRVLISGTVIETGNQTAIANSPNISVTTSGSPLPPTDFLPETVLIDGVCPLERYEGMLLNFAITAASGSDNFNSIDAYASFQDRPFREPGLLTPGVSGIPVFDGNPELFNFDPNGLGQPNFIFYNAGDQLSGIGILEEFGFGYELSPIEPVTYVSVPVSRAVRARTEEEITIGSLNTLLLLESENNYQLRLSKNVNYIAELMQFPDVVAIQEIGGQNELDDLIFRLRQLDPERGDYQGFAPPTDGSLNVGFLVHQRIGTPEYEELGGSEFFSGGGFLHNRFPLLATFTVPGTEDTRLQVLNLHIRSLNGIDDDIEVRRRRHEQAVSIANMVEALRNDNLIVVGDYNAFQFTDGYVDVYNQISGLPSQGALIETEPIVDPPLNVAADEIPATERYSFVFQGSAQQLDHCLYNELDELVVNEFAFARGNADASVNYANNAVQLPRASDHDGFVFYLGIDEVSSTTQRSETSVKLLHANPMEAGGRILYRQLPKNSSIVLHNVNGQKVVEFSALPRAGGSGSITLPANLTAGTYALSVVQAGRPLLTTPLLLR